MKGITENSTRYLSRACRKWGMGSQTLTGMSERRGSQGKVMITKASYFFLSESGFLYVAQAGLKLMIQPQSPKCWNYRYAPPGSARLTTLALTRLAKYLIHFVFLGIHNEYFPLRFKRRSNYKKY
jgi:hypothetical protein